MRKRHRLLIGLVASLILPAFLIGGTFLPAEPGISKANFHQIQVGMAETEVVALLGGPGMPSDFEHSENMKIWGEWGTNDDVFVYVYFDERGLVQSKNAQRQPWGAKPWPNLIDQLCSFFQRN